MTVDEPVTISEIAKWNDAYHDGLSAGIKFVIGTLMYDLDPLDPNDEPIDLTVKQRHDIAEYIKAKADRELFNDQGK